VIPGKYGEAGPGLNYRTSSVLGFERMVFN
jgi:hypothetical protein